jgi:hypothetical protein
MSNTNEKLEDAIVNTVEAVLTTLSGDEVSGVRAEKSEVSDNRASPSQSLDELKADYRIRYDKLRWLSWFDIESAIEAAARIGRKKGRNEILKQLPSSTRLRITPPKP